MPETVLRTTKCSGFGHPEFTLWCDPDFVFDTPWLLNWLQERVAAGATFLPGQTVQIGWSVLTVEAMEDGTVTLLESDLSGVPQQLARSITRTVVYFRRQRSVLESFDLLNRIAFAPLAHGAVACGRYQKGKALMLTRMESQNNDSGWFFGCLEDDHDHMTPANLRWDSLYALACLNPDTIDYLAMPVGSGFQLNAAGDLVEAALDDKPLIPTPGSYLHQKSLNRRAQ